MTEVCRLPFGMRLMASESGHEVWIDRGYRPWVSPKDMRLWPSSKSIQAILLDRLEGRRIECEEAARPYMADAAWLAMAKAAVLIDADVPTAVRRYIEELV